MASESAMCKPGTPEITPKSLSYAWLKVILVTVPNLKLTMTIPS